MRFPLPRHAPPAEGDMTPMIDMSFQLIAFFMVLLSFSDADQNERIHLPASELAKPTEVPFEYPITLQLTETGTVLYSDQELPVNGLQPILRQERAYLKLDKDKPRQATILIRADANAKAGVVQELIQMCQNLGFEKFVLRVRQEEGT